ncbi:hypothetical protein BDV36DRAFT_273460 [Aspergillus pseudocaelatus]|uniref:Uncharacterized protein n=1 Tax=Aspergillus pseudocaelatus TaxID=1825620 RepID=A0ABQ6W3U0_9EURO|nr:hypothetical protein BDV36DRAFT_273460 [Aspergillus pseudocaelatus]
MEQPVSGLVPSASHHQNKRGLLGATKVWVHSRNLLKQVQHSCLFLGEVVVTPVAFSYRQGYPFIGLYLIWGGV